MLLRKYRPDDIQEIAALFYETVNTVNRRDYSPEQTAAWSAGWKELAQKNSFFLSLYTVVAEEKGHIVGYGNIDESGYLDHLFVHKDCQGRGIASTVCDMLEEYAQIKNVKEISVHASITAKPFFEKRGYRVIKEQQVTVRGVTMTNFAMKKLLNVTDESCDGTRN